MCDEPVARYCPQDLTGTTRTGVYSMGAPNITCVMFSKQGELLASYNDEVCVGGPVSHCRPLTVSDCLALLELWWWRQCLLVDRSWQHVETDLSNTPSCQVQFKTMPQTIEIHPSQGSTALPPAAAVAGTIPGYLPFQHPGCRWQQQQHASTPASSSNSSSSSFNREQPPADVCS
jgi:hypothetical protein